MKRSAIDCLRRAALSTRANAGLVLLALLQSFLFTVLFVVSLLPPVLVLGGMALLQGAWTAEALEEWLAGLADRARRQPRAPAPLAARLPAPRSALGPGVGLVPGRHAGGPGGRRAPGAPRGGEPLRRLAVVPHLQPARLLRLGRPLHVALLLVLPPERHGLPPAGPRRQPDRAGGSASATRPGAPRRPTASAAAPRCRCCSPASSTCSGT